MKLFGGLTEILEARKICRVHIKAEMARHCCRGFEGGIVDALREIDECDGIGGSNPEYVWGNPENLAGTAQTNGSKFSLQRKLNLSARLQPQVAVHSMIGLEQSPLDQLRC